MRLQRPRFNPEIDADVAVAVIDRNIAALSEKISPLQKLYVFEGMHQRTAKGDELSLSVSSSQKRSVVKYSLNRDSLYHILPEYLFHPLDRYADTEGDKEEFLRQREAQKQVEADAKEYFYIYDRTFNDLRIAFQHHLNDNLLDNEAFIIDFLTENEDVNRNNPFISACLPQILSLRANRGSQALINIALKATFGQNLVELKRAFREIPVPIDSDNCHINLDGTIDDLFCGNEFTDWVEVISVRYQTEILSPQDIGRITEELKEFTVFFRRWFLAGNQELRVAFSDYAKAPVIAAGSGDGQLFLNYNTQLLVS